MSISPFNSSFSFEASIFPESPEKKVKQPAMSKKSKPVKRSLFDAPLEKPKFSSQMTPSWFDYEENEGCSAFFNSPESSPSKTSSRALSELSSISPLTDTPEKVKKGKRMLKEMDLGCAPLPKVTKVLNESIETLQKEATDSPNKKQRSKHTREMYQTIMVRASNESPDIVEKYGRVVEVLHTVPVLQKVVRDLRQIDNACVHHDKSLPRPELIVNYPHIVEPVDSTTGERAKGWHFCQLGKEDLLSGCIYSPSGVFTADFRHRPEQPSKRSTFFPQTIETVEQLDQLIQSAQGKHVCSKGNRSLFYISTQDLWLETLSKSGYINTAYPIFFKDSWADGQEYPVFRDYPPISSCFVFKAAHEAIVKYAQNSTKYLNPIRFVQEVGEEVNIYVDIASQFPPEMGISQGIYFVFDRTLFNSIEYIEEISIEQ